jgi:spore photoproduct lyase
MSDKLSQKVKNEVFFEVIFMTYSYVHRKINNEAFPEALELYQQEVMTGRGMGKYCYKQEIRAEGEVWLKNEIEKRFGPGKILYFS